MPNQPEKRPILLRILCTVSSQMLKSLAILLFESPALNLASTRSINDCEIGGFPRPARTLLPCFSPRDCLPLLTQSFALSCSVPINKWFGLTHAGVSQRCKIQKFSGTIPREIENANRCAMWSLLDAKNFPYPFLFSGRIQSQHSSSDAISTQFQNLTWSFSEKSCGANRSDIKVFIVRCFAGWRDFIITPSRIFLAY